MDWFNNTGVAIGIFLGFCAGEVLIFSLLLVITKYLKLPKYASITDEKNVRYLSGKLTL